MARVADVFPGGIFFWSFDDGQSISAAKYLLDLFPEKTKAIYPFSDPSKLSHEDVLKLARDIFKQFEASVLLVLDHADTLRQAGAEDKEKTILVTLLQEVLSKRHRTVKVLATSQKSLGWPGEKLIHLDGFTVEDKGHQLFVEHLDFIIKEKMKKEANKNTQLLRDLVQSVDGHPLSLKLLGRAVSNSDKSLKYIVEHCDTLIAEEDVKMELKKHFETTIDTLKPQQLLYLYTCSLFKGQITKGVIACVSHFIKYDKAFINMNDGIVAKILQELYDRGLLFKMEKDEYRIHVGLREGVRQHNPKLKLRLHLPIPYLINDVFVMGIPFEHGK